ncbi:MAG: DNA mismatch repair endonuclease MutL [Pleurocapsa minor GSE-CHR-MK-17-07R]|jgi:DNA mismatch repair protein MutL|nr:DNA mismatch repair endonuclease MutL [Pleurocapsa minor GSE-CHR-MK 17-07R]
MTIHRLTEDVVVKIAAGEVIERPASVIKELVENSLDAGARFIRVSVVGDGRQRIEIADDGQGIPADEVDLAFARHATSKLTNADDLFDLHTLGFRGEALASISAVSRVTLTTRAAAETQGTHMRIEGGVETVRRAVGVPQGTHIIVENLFFNTPARLKFLKGEQAEKRQISLLITRYAMAYPQVKFVLEQDGRENFRSNGTGRLIDVLVSAMGLENIRQLIEIDDAHGPVRVVGYVSTPSLHRNDRSRITLFVNGRWVQDTSLTFAIVQAYHTMLMTGRYPIAVLMVDVPPADVDVNVHPTKAEVRFREPDHVFSAVQRAVRQALIAANGSSPVRAMSASEDSGRPWPTESFSRQSALGFDVTDAGQHARHADLRPGADASSVIGYHHAGQDSEPVDRPRTLPLLRIIGQVGASYIVAEGPAGMYLIDQHAAHERVMYEAYWAAYQRSETITQLALEAQSFTLSPDDARLLDANLEVLSALGFVVEEFGPNAYTVRAVPAILADEEPASVISQILGDLAQGLQPGQRAAEDKIIKRVCKRASVKAGQILSLDQMQSILRQLERCEQPLTCPHGRPTMIHLSGDQLAREFGRLGS